MKWNCELIQDLLPLYEEGLCSPPSRRAVEEHLGECEACRRLTAPLPIEEPEDLPAADRAVAKSMKKVRRRWLTSLVATLLLIPTLLLSVNQYRGKGLCFTNPDEVYTAWRFLHALETENWEQAAKMHDFSEDYLSIQEALQEDVSFWGMDFTTFDLLGQPYAASRWLERTDAIPKTLPELYGYLYNRIGTAMVPQAVWEQLIAIDPTAVDQNGWQYWLNGELYGKITTEWGDFVVSEGRGYDSAFEYCQYFNLLPAAIYEEAIPAIEAEAQALYSSTHADIGWVAELTEEAFTAEMIRRYTDELSALEDTVTFDCTGYNSAYRMERCWYITFDVTVTQGSRSLDIQISLDVSGGKITFASISHEPGAAWLDAIDRALYPSAHPEY